MHEQAAETLLERERTEAEARAAEEEKFQRRLGRELRSSRAHGDKLLADLAQTETLVRAHSPVCRWIRA